MEPIATRLKSFLQFKGLTTTAFTRILQYNSCEKVARLFRVPGAKPSVDILEDIAVHFEELNLRWLISGQGEMLRRPVGLAAQPQLRPETEMTAAIQQEHDPKLLFIHTANNDEYILHQSFPSFLLQSTSDTEVKASRVTLTHSEKEMEKVSKPLLGSLINFIENLRDEQ